MVYLLPNEISCRLIKLVDSNLLADIKRARDKNIIIHRGLLVELYKYGVSNEQLPNLNAIAHCIPGAKYGKTDIYWAIDCTIAQLAGYFDNIIKAAAEGRSRQTGVAKEYLTDEKPSGLRCYLYLGDSQDIVRLS